MGSGGAHRAVGGVDLVGGDDVERRAHPRRVVRRRFQGLPHPVLRIEAAGAVQRAAGVLVATADRVVLVDAAPDLVVRVDPVQMAADADQEQPAALVAGLVAGEAPVAQAVADHGDELGRHEAIEVPVLRNGWYEAVAEQLAHPERVGEPHDELTVAENLGIRTHSDGPTGYTGAVPTDHDPAVLLYPDDAGHDAEWYRFAPQANAPPRRCPPPSSRTVPSVRTEGVSPARRPSGRVAGRPPRRCASVVGTTAAGRDIPLPAGHPAHAVATLGRTPRDLHRRLTRQPGKEQTPDGDEALHVAPRRRRRRGRDRARPAGDTAGRRRHRHDDDHRRQGRPADREGARRAGGDRGGRAG
ncbi:hypothetical protein FRACA_960003 [Frankia canadensis]|uniref:Uncharacterized protein n=1 Tax=Frankia canadensis TaxID=1836972 RepID=A0A2I2L2P5_9ACTN|nr:hypothetical protein FRACA_960003 [Frankia canadensis]SOU59490.1 hypothetical protein FRACA_960003 [Frankia canadensis]